MLAFGKWKELTVCQSQKQCDEICSLLREHEIPYTVKTRARNSPSALSFGSRERAGIFAQNPAAAYQYYIYVERGALADAKALCARPR